MEVAGIASPTLREDGVPGIEVDIGSRALAGRDEDPRMTAPLPRRPGTHS
jgi:hypothetical protein